MMWLTLMKGLRGYRYDKFKQVKKHFEKGMLEQCLTLFINPILFLDHIKQLD